MRASIWSNLSGLNGRRTPAFPTHIILQRLKDRKIDSQLALVNLLIDFWREDIAKSASYADLDARKAFLELCRATFIGSRGTAAIERLRTLLFRRLVKLVECRRVLAERLATGGQRN